MSDEPKTTPDEPKRFTPEEFQQAYVALCKQMGWQLSAIAMLVPTNHGTYEIATRLQVVKMTE